jgi:type IV pilus assembly protein PilA
VAIIGILASVGVTAYSGYTASAKAVKAKSNHKVLHKYLSTEFLKCEIGLVDEIMDVVITCNVRDGATVMGAIMSPARRIIQSNPYGMPNPAQHETPRREVGVIIDAAREDLNVGYVTVNYHHGLQSVILRTCVRIPCATQDDENILTSMFRTEDRQ